MGEHGTPERTGEREGDHHHQINTSLQSDRDDHPADHIRARWEVRQVPVIPTGYGPHEAMLELLRIDCRETAERIETDPGYRRRVRNKMFSSWLRGSTSAVAYTAVLYASMLAASNVPGKGVKDTVGEEKWEVTDRERRTINLRGLEVEIKKSEDLDKLKYLWDGKRLFIDDDIQNK